MKDYPLSEGLSAIFKRIILKIADKNESNKDRGSGSGGSKNKNSKNKDNKIEDNNKFLR